MEYINSYGRRSGAVGIILITAALAVVINLIVYAIGKLAGATYDFERGGEMYHVDPFTLAMFTALPILIGLTITALAARFGNWAYAVALIVGPVAAIGSTFIMTFPEDDLDTQSLVVLVASHVVLGIVIALGVLALRASRSPQTPKFA